MKSAIWIPPATRERLANPAPPGQRHRQIVQVAASLTAQGMNPEAVFYQIRPNYGPDISDAEIRAVIRWAGQIPQRVNSVPRQFSGRNKTPVSNIPGNCPRINSSPESAETAVKRFLGGFSCTEADLWEASPFRLFGDVESDPVSLLTALYQPEEFINIVAEFALLGGRPRPKFGTTLLRDEWLARFRECGPPHSAAGVWSRPNPTDGKGISDANTAVFHFALLEFDSIPLSLQLSFFARLPLPIAAIITSGGKSLHAWVKIAAENAEKYRESVSHLFWLLKPCGIDAANKNPARLSRLPGVCREIGGEGDKRQRLFYLNPFPKTQPIFQ